MLRMHPQRWWPPTYNSLSLLNFSFPFHFLFLLHCLQRASGGQLVKRMKKLPYHLYFLHYNRYAAHTHPNYFAQCLIHPCFFQEVLKFLKDWTKCFWRVEQKCFWRIEWQKFLKQSKEAIACCNILLLDTIVVDTKFGHNCSKSWQLGGGLVHNCYGA